MTVKALKIEKCLVKAETTTMRLFALGETASFPDTPYKEDLKYCLSVQ